MMWNLRRRSTRVDARSKEGSESESTCDTEDELDADSAKGSEGFRGSISEVGSALEGFSPRVGAWYRIEHGSEEKSKCAQR